MKYDYTDVIDPLLVWFYGNKRALVWRDHPIPYYVWISEIMLQQTRVEAVKDYFDRFIRELPDVRALANVEEDKLMKLWEGLGYYNRARNLKKAAQIIVNDYNGMLPEDYVALLNLPGIGPYTAGAIASIAFQIPEPAVDGNVLRVMKRVAGSYDDITKASVKKELEEDLRMIMPRECPGDFNQSIMELGAMVCIPNGRPLCEQCPIRELCTAYQLGIQMGLPVKPAKKKRKVEEKTILLLECNNEYAIRKRGSTGLLAGLWELPQIEGKLKIEELDDLLAKMGAKNYIVEDLGEAKHIFSHIEWHMVGYLVHMTKLPIVEKTDKVCEASNDFHESSMENCNGIIIKNQYKTKCGDYFDSFIADWAWASKDIIVENYSLPTAFKSYYLFMR